ncbi:MAG: radical SAM protein, partial [Oscillospiraceae bacterium]|nr:radical SAM protein [Oscillospiraceae bacterium]
MIMDSCSLCPRMCHAQRTEDAGSGFCKMGTLPVVARAALHYWEEPCISGKKGSGAVFFTGCTLQCIFCQNYQISTKREVGKSVTPQQLSDIFFRLIEQGANNINLVSGAQFVPAIVEALSIRPLPVPVVYNSGGYESLEALHMLDGLVQIYLPDYKYDDNSLAKRFSGAPDYTEHARAAVLEMVRQTGPVQMDGNGILQRGTIVRHLLLPGHTKNSISALDWIAENLPKGTLVSLMGQYTPCGRVEEYPELQRKVTAREYRKVQQHLFDLGLDGFVQEL